MIVYSSWEHSKPLEWLSTVWQVAISRRYDSPLGEVDNGVYPMRWAAYGSCRAYNAAIRTNQTFPSAPFKACRLFQISDLYVKSHPLVSDNNTILSTFLKENNDITATSCSPSLTSPLRLRVMENKPQGNQSYTQRGII